MYIVHLAFHLQNDNCFFNVQNVSLQISKRLAYKTLAVDWSLDWPDPKEVLLSLLQ